MYVNMCIYARIVCAGDDGTSKEDESARANTTKEDPTSCSCLENFLFFYSNLSLSLFSLSLYLASFSSIGFIVTTTA